MPYKIPLLVPSVPNFEVIEKYLRRIDDSKKYSNFGPLERELRTRLAEIWKVPSENIVTACNATLALQGAIETSEPNDFPWKVPSWTFVATPLAIQKAGKPFSFVDSNLQTWRAIFSEDDENVVDVLPFGDDLDLERLRKKPLTNLVIDAAASFAAISKPLPTCSHRFALVVSLHATKLLPAGEGAIMVSNCSDWAQRFRNWTNFGFSSIRKPVLLGTNAKLSEYAAAVSLGSLDEFPGVKNELHAIQNRAHTVTKKMGLDCNPSMRKGLVSPYWILVFKEPKQKLLARNLLHRNGIESRDWWEDGCHNVSIFNHNNLSLPNTEMIASTSLGIPMHLGISSADLDCIEDSLILNV